MMCAKVIINRIYLISLHIIISETHQLFLGCVIFVTPIRFLTELLR